MQITDILAQMGGIQSMARELGVSESQAQAGAEALAPAILGGLKKQTQTAEFAGMGGLGGLLGQLGGGGLLDQVLGSQPTNVTQGNDVLGQLFGSKDVSRTVAQSAATQSGLDPSLLKKMLPMLAMLVAGYLAKQHGAAAQAAQAGQSGQAGDADGGVLGGLGALGGLGGGLGGLLGGLLGGNKAGAAPQAGGGLGSLLDLNGDGNALDDILRMAGKALR